VSEPGPRSVTVRSAAKINLALRVGSLGPDGFHRLATVYQAVSLYDEVTATRRRTGIRVSVDGAAAASVPTDGSNLATLAAQQLAAAHRVSAGVALRIRKQIPVAGGMAGGSTDAAAALVACDALWGTEAGRDGLVPLAARLGSDVPFCLVGGTAVGTGHGERIHPALARGSFSWVLAVAERGLSTPAVYAELDRGRGGRSVAEPAVPPEVMNALRAGDAEALGPALCNDLAAPALRLRPQLRQVLEAGAERGPLGAGVCGSGPTCMFLAGDAEHALDIAVHLAGAGVCRSVVRATGPVPGARVVG
jgi:4-diphosphocytidyl-2-C-methyl-D-erythritol kinase